MAFTLDTTFGTLLENPRAKELLEKKMPGITSNPLIGLAKGMTLNTILSMPQAAQMGITKEQVESLLAEVNKYA